MPKITNRQLERVEPDHLKSYLASIGFAKSHDFNDSAEVWKKSGLPLLVPKVARGSDYADAVRMIINQAAELQECSAESVLLALKNGAGPQREDRDREIFSTLAGDGCWPAPGAWSGLTDKELLAAAWELASTHPDPQVAESVRALCLRLNVALEALDEVRSA